MISNVRSLCSLAALALALTACSASGAQESGDAASQGVAHTVPPAGQGEEEEDEEQAPPSYIQICVAWRTRVRAGYRACDNARPRFRWYFLAFSKRVPPVGGKARGGSFKRPEGDEHRAGAKGGIGSKIAIDDDWDAVQICVRKPSRVRVGDRPCVDEEHGFAWYYIGIDDHVPAPGKTAEYGSFWEPDGFVYRARGKGGLGSDIAIDEDGTLDAGDEDETQEDDDSGPTVTTCSGTVINGACADDGGTFDDDDDPVCRWVGFGVRRHRVCS
ncbi:hypothetical protein [Sphaerisporangium dianthi]|uniref:Uncharacterized protein n=1 Tax=Sphaerisporangium dianthi TaxID=1436120 RepID=A0ABV9CP34_9ACTN